VNNFLNEPNFDDKNYHFFIIEKSTNAFFVYLDIDGIYYFQSCIIEAFEYRGFDHSMIHKNGKDPFNYKYAIFTAIRLFIDYTPRVNNPSVLSMAYRKPGKVLELAITSNEAHSLFDSLTVMANKILNEKEVNPIKLEYGLSIEYLKEW
jgi:hypothetical protein